MNARAECELTLTRADLEEALAGVLDDRRTIDEKTHRAHHDYVQDLIEARRRHRARWDTIWTQVSGWLVIVTVTAVGTSAVAWLAHVFKRGG